MKLKLSIFISILALIMFYACDKAETTEDIWRLDNEAQFAKISVNPEYTKLNSYSGKGYIMYKVIEEGNGTRSPFFTEQAKVKYTGWYKRNWTMPDTYTDDRGDYTINKIVFDTTLKNNVNVARTFKVNGVVDGFSTALQHMKEGDKWEIWMPYKLAYGDIGSGDIPGYTTLVFEIELVSIVE